MGWLLFLVEDRWSCFRITQQTAALGLAALLVGALRAHTEFRSVGWFLAYVASVTLALGLNVALYVAMERRSRQASVSPPVEVAADLLPV